MSNTNLTLSAHYTNGEHRKNIPAIEYTTNFDSSTPVDNKKFTVSYTENGITRTTPFTAIIQDINWSIGNLPSGFTNAIKCVTFENGKFVAVGANGKIAYSRTLMRKPTRKKGKYGIKKLRKSVKKPTKPKKKS